MAPLGGGALRGAEALAAVGAGAVARAEDALGGGSRLRGEALTIGEDEEAPVQALVL